MGGRPEGAAAQTMEGVGTGSAAAAAAAAGGGEGGGGVAGGGRPSV